MGSAAARKYAGFQQVLFSVTMLLSNIHSVSAGKVGTVSAVMVGFKHTQNVSLW